MLKIAIPVAGGLVCPHFGGADAFAVFTADPSSRTVGGREDFRPPAHERGVFPAWLHSLGVSTVLAEGMGGRAVAMLSSYGIEVVMGASGDDPAALVADYLKGDLVTSGEACSGGGLHDCGHHEG
jgi:predicted Fe-Mo cluster-binding NifX family protein